MPPKKTARIQSLVNLARGPVSGQVSSSSSVQLIDKTMFNLKPECSSVNTADEPRFCINAPANAETALEKTTLLDESPIANLTLIL